MCIIVAKPVGIEMPSDETLRVCFQSNPDGAGFMYADGKAVHIQKGFMNLDDFIEALDNALPEQVRKETGIVMHFRIATSGGVHPGCCHPFPVTDDKNNLTALQHDCPIAVAHNGVIKGRKTDKKWSDTMDYISRIVAPLNRIAPHFMSDDDALDILDETCTSKLAFLNYAGDITTIGNFVEDDGILYSNTSYLKMNSRFSSYGHLWDDLPNTGSAMFGYDVDAELEELVKLLPYSACASCSNSTDCALSYPYCENEAMSIAECSMSKYEMALPQPR